MQIYISIIKLLKNNFSSKLKKNNAQIIKFKLYSRNKLLKIYIVIDDILHD